ncbi:MAG TPA: alpha/beta hydrolase [Pyrinomonadaceae bacterium]|nr:alpha/beta hydrolase [Pyrinomonadaceae bacterium]
MSRNKKIKLLLLVTATTFGTVVAQKPAKLEDPEWISEIASKRIVYNVPLMKRVSVRKNLTYKRVNGAELKLDVYSLAAMRRGRRPAVIFIHGGRIPPNLLTTPKEWGAFVSFGQLVAASGFVGVTFNHRFYAWESLVDSQNDLMDLIAYVRAHADEFGVDGNRIVLWAVSAGGIFLSQPLRDRPPYIKCLVGYYAELDLRNERASAPTSVSDETLRDFSPAYHLSKGSRGVPPIFIARAGLDDTTLNAGLDRFVQVALSSNVTLDLANHATGHHGFDVEDDDERSREILKRTIEFIKLHS